MPAMPLAGTLVHPMSVWIGRVRRNPIPIHHGWVAPDRSCSFSGLKFGYAVYSTAADHWGRCAGVQHLFENLIEHSLSPVFHDSSSLAVTASVAAIHQENRYVHFPICLLVPEPA